MRIAEFIDLPEFTDNIRLECEDGEFVIKDYLDMIRNESSNKIIHDLEVYDTLIKFAISGLKHTIKFHIFVDSAFYFFKTSELQLEQGKYNSCYNVKVINSKYYDFIRSQINGSDVKIAIPRLTRAHVREVIRFNSLMEDSVTICSSPICS